MPAPDLFNPTRGSGPERESQPAPQGPEGRGEKSSPPPLVTLGMILGGLAECRSRYAVKWWWAYCEDFLALLDPTDVITAKREFRKRYDLLPGEKRKR